jgi:hypothetical protein
VDKSLKQSHLTEVDRHIAAIQARIKRQHECVARFRAGGHDATLAVEALDTMVKTLAVFEQHRNTIIETLDQSPPHW